MSADWHSKKIWSHEDLECMNWRECQIFGMAFYKDKKELAIDTEYIFECLEPAENDEFFTLIRSPVTLVFEEVRNLEVSLFYCETNISSLERLPIDPTDADCKCDWLSDWRIDCYDGEIIIRASGFKMFVRAPALANGYRTLEDRGGICFDRYFSGDDSFLGRDSQ